MQVIEQVEADDDKLKQQTTRIQELEAKCSDQQKQLEEQRKKQQEEI